MTTEEKIRWLAEQAGLHRLLCRVLGHHYRFVDDGAFWLWMEEAEPKAVLSKSTITYFVRCRRCGR